MKSIYTKCLLAAAAAAIAGSAHAQLAPSSVANVNDSPLYVRTDGLPAFVAKRVEEEAGKGLQPLRQYVQRTRFIHQLDLVSMLMTREQAQLAMARDDKAHLVQIARK
jgi:hypothetical protein